MSTSKLTNKDKLKRLLYLSNIKPKYISGCPDKYSLYNVDLDALILDQYVDKSEEFLTIIVAAAECKFIPKRSTLFYVLAKFANHPKIPEHVKTNVNKTAIDICKTDEDFFDYLKYCTLLRKGKTKIPTTLRKRIQTFYKNKSADELVKSYTDHKSCHGWTHKSLIKLTHISSDCPTKNVVINFILFKSAKSENIDDENSKKLIEILTEVEQLRSTGVVSEAIPIIQKLKLSHTNLSPELQKSAEVWDAVLPQMDIKSILKTLPKLYRLGFLKLNSDIYKKVVDSLTDLQKIKDSKIHPIEVFIYLKNFEKGGKPVDPKLLDHLTNEKKLNEEQLAKVKTAHEPKCPVLITTIHKCLSMAYNGLKSTGLKFFITIDVTNKMDLPCLHNKNITALEAALSITLTFLKVEQHVSVAIYKDKDIQIINMKTSDSINENMKKIKELKSTYLIPTSSVEWALNKTKNFDVFINFIHHHEYYATVPKESKDKLTKCTKVFDKYHEVVNKSAKIANICLTSPKISIADGSPNVIDISGLDAEVPRVLQAFLKGKFR